MRLRPAMLLIAAIVIAAGTAVFANSWLKAQHLRELGAGGSARLASRSVLVARAAIPRGEILRPHQLVWEPWPAGELEGAYIVEGGPRNPESFAGWVALNAFAKGEPVTLEKIVSPGDRGFLAAVLTPGMRAISVPVTVISGVSGLVFPGDRVDLLLTYPVPSNNAAERTAATAAYEHRATATVLRGLRVIAIDQKLQAKLGEAVVAHTATFEVTPKMAEAIALASEIGKLSLSLHSLVATAAEPAANGAAEMPEPASKQVAEAPGRDAGNTPIAAVASYTLDSQIGPLLPKANGGDGGLPEATPVTTLHGLVEQRRNFPLHPAAATTKVP